MSTKRTEFWIHALRGGGDTVELRISRDRLAAALVSTWTDHPGPIVLNEAWGNGDSARIVVERIPWRETEWRVTTEGWIKGLYRIWCSDKGHYRVERAGEQFAAGPFETLEMAQAAVMRHADTHDL